MAGASQTQAKPETWPQLAAPQPTTPLNMFSRPLNASPEQQLKNATAGALSEDGLYRAPKAVTKWALEKAIQGAPRVPWSASGFARGLRGWILDHVTAIHSIEFSAFHPAGFAGACDALVDLDGEGPFIVDWKTTGKSIHKSNESQLHNYRHQTGAYSLMLNYRTGIQAVGGAVVVARRSGSPNTVETNRFARPRQPSRPQRIRLPSAVQRTTS